MERFVEYGGAVKCDAEMGRNNLVDVTRSGNSSNSLPTAVAKASRTFRHYREVDDVFAIALALYSKQVYIVLLSAHVDT